MDWKKSLFMFFRKNGGNPVYNDLESFIENLLEQERKRMSDEVGKLENDTETVYNAGKCDYDNHVNKESVLSIVNKKCKFC